ncbi:hypothetical protein HispidOSU_000835, partial [Sigmodon hispidus]
MDKIVIQKYHTVNGHSYEEKPYERKRWLVLCAAEEVEVVPKTLMVVVKMFLAAMTILGEEEISVAMVASVAAMVVVEDMVAVGMAIMNL